MPLRIIKNKIKDIYGDDSFSWFDNSYIVDWIVVFGLIALNLFIQAQPVFERDFSPNDPLIQHPYTPQQILPAVIVGFIGGYRSSVHEIHHGLLAAMASSALSHLITDALKNRVGRLRPDFLSRCQWDAAQHVCTGYGCNEILDGRKSFPSGHTSSAFVGMTFITFVTPSGGFFLRSRFARLCLVLSPLFFATWVAITRIEDYRHHKEDVIVGSGIGIFSAIICYLLYWPNPFSASSFSAETVGCPRLASPSFEGPDFESV
ncbi:phosphatidic acid phosphatase type 2/haloperoxidase [Russula brevipes]|nr:phosphatidic acid phosphatase type 2/haloperoxidase [Russula brevipes]